MELYSLRAANSRPSPSDVTAHRGQTAMARVSQDSFVGHAVVRRRSSRSRRAGRGDRGALEQDLADRVRNQTGGLDSATPVDLAEQRAS